MTNATLGRDAYDFPAFNPRNRSELVDVAARHCITHWDSTRDYPEAGMTLAITHQAGTYQQFKLVSLGGSGAKIDEVWYYNDHGAYPLPRDMYELYGDSTVVIASGAPAHLALKTSGGGKMVLHPANGTSDPMAAIPEERAEVQGDIEDIRGGHGQANFVQHYQLMDRSPLPSDILHPGGTYGVKAILENPGVLAASFTIQAVAGHTGTQERFVTEPLEIRMEAHQKKEFWTDITIPAGEGQPFVHIVGILPDGRSSGETDTGGGAKEKQEDSEGGIEQLDRAAGKAGVASAYALRDDGGDVRIRSLFKDPIFTLAAIDRTREAYATILDIIHTVQAPIERGRLEVAVAEAVGREKQKTLVAQKEEMEEGLRVKKVGLEEGGKGIENILVDMGLEEAVLAQLEKRLMLAVSAYQVADAEGGLAGGLQSKVIAAAKSLVPKVIESARTTVNGVRYLRDRIDETATILKKIG